jgi:hypothetical protein
MPESFSCDEEAAWWNQRRARIAKTDVVRHGKRASLSPFPLQLRCRLNTNSRRQFLSSVRPLEGCQEGSSARRGAAMVSKLASNETILENGDVRLFFSWRHE